MAGYLYDIPGLVEQSSAIRPANFYDGAQNSNTVEIEMSETFEVRKVLTQGGGHLSHSVVIPHKFLADMKITKGDYVKLYLDQQESKIWIQKLDGGQIENK